MIDTMLILLGVLKLALIVALIVNSAKGEPGHGFCWLAFVVSNVMVNLVVFYA